MTMIEKVAAAMLAEFQKAMEYADNRGEGRAVLDGYFDLNAVARAAIAAMREPTPGMERTLAGLYMPNADIHGDFTDTDRENVGCEAYRLMIDAALTEK